MSVNLHGPFHDIACDHEGCLEVFRAPRSRRGQHGMKPNMAREAARREGWHCPGRDWRNSPKDYCEAHRKDAKAPGCAANGSIAGARHQGDPERGRS